MKPLQIYGLAGVVAVGALVVALANWPSTTPAPAAARPPVVSSAGVTPRDYNPSDSEPQEPVTPELEPVATRPSRPAPVRVERPAARPAPVTTARRDTTRPAPAASAPAPTPAPVATAPAPQRPEATQSAQTPARAEARRPDNAPWARDLPPAPPNKVTIPAGTILAVRLVETLSTDRNSAGDAFHATLDQPLQVDGFVIAERGARIDGKVAATDPGGRVKGRASLELELTRITLSDGQRIELNTNSYQQLAATSTRQDAAKVAAAAGIGAAIGAIAGGGKGAAIGAASGGAAGAGGVLLTRGGPAVLPSESRVSFRLSDAVVVTERN